MATTTATTNRLNRSKSETTLNMSNYHSNNNNSPLEQEIQQEYDYSVHHYYSQKALPACPSGHRTSSGSTLSDTIAWGQPPYDIQRTNCIPAYGPFDITHFKDDEEDITSASSRSPSPINSIDEDMFGTKQSHTPSSSGDSGYGTTTRRKRSSSSVTTTTANTKKELTTNHKVQDLFEAIFTAPVSTPQPPTLKIHPNATTAKTSQTGSSSKLSLLFSKSRTQQQQQKKKEPHYVKFQTWSTNNNSNAQNACSVSSTPSGSIRRPHEEKLLKYQPHITTDWQQNQTETLPPTIKVQDPLKKNPHSRRRTDPSVLPIPPKILTTLPSSSPSVRNIAKQHTRCKSIGSPLDIPVQNMMKSPITPNPSISLSSQQHQQRDPHNDLELYDQDGNLMARYKLGNVIGKGHFGTVYRALDLITGKTVAIKQINLKDARKSDIEDMMQEASLLSSLTHTNVVKYEGFIQTQEHMHIVLEFVENGSLLHTLKHFGNELPEHLVATYCHDILQGLVYLHQQDVVHCDLKAANILTTKTGDVKLSDFGVSLNLKLKNHEENLVSGTPFWSKYTYIH